jgi:hypothetical protein
VNDDASAQYERMAAGFPARIPKSEIFGSAWFWHLIARGSAVELGDMLVGTEVRAARQQDHLATGTTGKGLEGICQDLAAMIDTRMATTLEQGGTNV